MRKKGRRHEANLDEKEGCATLLEGPIRASHSNKLSTCTIMMNFQKSLLFGAAAVFLWGCTPEEALLETSSAPEPGEVLEERRGALVAEFIYPRSWGGEGVEVQAQFLDARGVDVESALEALEVWIPRQGLEEGDCQVVMPRGPASGDSMSLHLLNLGPIFIESPDERLELPPRRFPDLLSSFHGVVYGSEWSWERDVNLVEYYPGAVYSFSAPGSANAGGFDVELVAPDPMIVVAVNGEELNGAQRLRFAPDEEVELIWESEDFTRGDVYIDLIAGPGARSPRLQCRASDQGAFVLPGDLIKAVVGTRQGAELALRRVHSHRASVDGLDETDFYFLTTDRLQVQLQR